MQKLFALLSLVLLSGACREKKPPLPSTVPVQRGPEQCTLDSARIIRLFPDSVNEIQKAVIAFYSRRQYSCAWVTSEGLNEYAGTFVNLLNHETVTADSSGRNERLYELFRRARSVHRNACADSTIQSMETEFTAEFFRYAKRNWGGLDDSLFRKANWFIRRKQLDYAAILNDFIRHDGKMEEPVYHQYVLLEDALSRYRDIEDKGGWPLLPDSVKLQRGDSSEEVAVLRRILDIQGDIPFATGSAAFDEMLENGVRRFQKRHGLQEDGKVARKTAAALRVTVRERIEQILVNLERCRWVPHPVAGEYIAVNIPEFRLRVYEKGSVLWSSRVIVGISDTVFSTVIFNDSLEFVVFAPYWNVPKNIFFKEVLPKIKEDPGYLASHNLEVVGRSGNPVPPSKIRWSEYTDNFPYILRERPGPKNSLGRVKFLFPNPFEIYFHDTPAKELFNQPLRAFSHGCIRIEDPQRLAEYLLRDDPAYGKERIEKLMNGKKEVFVRLKRKVPVFITYFTAWVENGKVQFRDDVYGHDAVMKSLLFVN